MKMKRLFRSFDRNRTSSPPPSEGSSAFSTDPILIPEEIEPQSISTSPMVNLGWTTNHRSTTKSSLMISSSPPVVDRAPRNGHPTGIRNFDTIRITSDLINLSSSDLDLEQREKSNAASDFPEKTSRLLRSRILPPPSPPISMEEVGKLHNILPSASSQSSHLRSSIVLSTRMNHKFSTTGKVLTKEDIEKIRKNHEYCSTCGKQTHQGISLTKRKITNVKSGVWKGICITCNPHKCPGDVLLAHQVSKRSTMLLQSQDIGGSDSSSNSQSSSVPRAKFSEVAAQAFRDAQRKVHLKRSTHNKVAESWDLLKDDLPGLGMDFFIQVFTDFPHLRALFPLGDDCTTEATMRANPLLKNHATLAMQMLGNAVMGISDTQHMIPQLRQLGRKHTIIGVKPEHFDDVYQTLVNVISKKIGNSKWTVETQEAWETVYTMVVSVMKDPSRHLDVEPAYGWALYHSGACLYLAIATPFRIAGFGGILQGSSSIYMNSLDFAAMLICALDAFGEQLELLVRLPGQAVVSAVENESKISTKASTYSVSGTLVSKLRFSIRFRLYRLVRRLDFSRWAHWRHLDIALLTSYGVEMTFHDLLKLPIIQERSFVTLWRALAFSAAITRIIALSRVVHFVRCAELVALKDSMLHRDQFQYLQIGKMLAALFYSLHLVGCLFSMVAQLEGLKHLDPALFTDGIDNFSDEGGVSSFPKWSHFAQRMMPLLINDAHPNTLNSYLHAVYWAFVNVTGIGNQAAAPETSLEISFALLVHLMGTAYYVWAVGTIFWMLQERSKKFYQVEEGISALTEFLNDCDIIKNDQDKFLSSYVMRNFVSKGNTSSSGDLPTDRPLVPDAAEQLPIHLRMELTLHSRAKALRTRGIKKCSADFSFALVETLDKTMALLPGDFLFQAGQKTTPRVYMVDKGMLEIFVDGVSKGCLYPGDIIGKGWLATQPIEAKEEQRHKAAKDWRSPDNLVIADIRAMSKCQIVVGLEKKSEVITMQRQFTKDIERLKKELKPKDTTSSERWDKVRLNNLKGLKHSRSLPLDPGPSSPFLNESNFFPT